MLDQAEIQNAALLSKFASMQLHVSKNKNTVPKAPWQKGE